ncbi:MAG: NADH-quinone oxidoreductase subunit J [Actinomycetota bacterium]|nr:NADH-quinone oxidoreductase subunit J [Actinomycetota bacterium]
MLAQNITFGVLALVMGVSAIRVVTTKNVVHAALYLVLVLAGVAGIFILLAAEFLAIVQVLVYIGAIVVLFLFGIMLTRAPIGKSNELDNDQRWVGATVGLGLFALLSAVLYDGFGRTKLDNTEVARTADVGLAIFQTYVIPFEVISVLLLAALVGAVVIARRD